MSFGERSYGFDEYERPNLQRERQRPFGRTNTEFWQKVLISLLETFAIMATTSTAALACIVAPLFTDVEGRIAFIGRRELVPGGASAGNVVSNVNVFL